MKAVFSSLALVVAIASPSVVSGASRLKGPEFITLSGQCLRVAVGGQDMTAACTGMLGGSSYEDGRSGIYFMLGNNHILTFSGAVTDKRDGFAIDKVIFNTGQDATKPQALRATGRCNYTDPRRGPVTIRCAGALGQGTSFTASFRTDGTAPQPATMR